MTHRGDDDVLRVPDGLRFSAGSEEWVLPPFSVARSEWVALAPAGAEPVADPSGTLSWILATMEEPLRGVVELLGHEVYALEYVARQRLRARIGYVHGYGGLLSNRTVRENIALPVSVHGRPRGIDEVESVEAALRDFGLETSAALRPHEMDGATRWRACLARALVLKPDWLVLEGLGNWQMDRGRGIGWRRLAEQHRSGTLATAICLPRQNPEFEAWFEEQGGAIVRFERIEQAAARRTST